MYLAVQFFFQMAYSPSNTSVSRYSMGVRQAARTCAGSCPVAMTGASGAPSASRNCPAMPSSMAAVPYTMPLCRQSGVLVPISRRGLASSSTWGSWAVFFTSAVSESCGPGMMTPPTRLPAPSTASMVTAVSRCSTTSGGSRRCKAATAAQSSSPPSWAGLSIRMRTPLFRPGPISMMGASHILRSASRSRPVSAGTTLEKITWVISWGFAPYSASMFTIL